MKITPLALDQPRLTNNLSYLNLLNCGSQTSIELAAVSIPRSHTLSSGYCCTMGLEVAMPTASGMTIGGSEVTEQDALDLLVFLLRPSETSLSSF